MRTPPPPNKKQQQQQQQTLSVVPFSPPHPARHQFVLSRTISEGACSKCLLLDRCSNMEGTEIHIAYKSKDDARVKLSGFKRHPASLIVRWYVVHKVRQKSTAQKACRTGLISQENLLQRGTVPGSLQLLNRRQCHFPYSLHNSVLSVIQTICSPWATRLCQKHCRDMQMRTFFSSE